MIMVVGGASVKPEAALSARKFMKRQPFGFPLSYIRNAYCNLIRS